jgi:hypothetical protein
LYLQNFSFSWAEAGNVNITNNSKIKDSFFPKFPGRKREPDVVPRIRYTLLKNLLIYTNVVVAITVTGQPASGIP